MRTVLNPQLRLAEVDIGAIQIDKRSRDDIPKLLLGLQYIYTHRELRDGVFEILKEVVADRSDGPGKVDVSVGRPGMDQWCILVLGTLRLCLNIDYDRVVELANNHGTLRQMLGHAGLPSELDPTEYTLQTVKDNLRLFTPEILGRINEVVVRGGHDLVKKSLRDACDEMNVRVDSFVVETDVHYPTDINLLLDAMRKVVSLCAKWCAQRDLSDWRQHQHTVRTIKRMCRKISKLKRSTARDEAKRAARDREIEQAHREYLETAERYLERACATRAKFAKEAKTHLVLAIELKEFDRFMQHAERQIDQIRRRVLEGASIPHEEKVFSIFEEHTEWISKGKAGVPVELGVKVAIVEDRHRFILNHRVLQQTEDVEAAVPLIEETQKKYGTLASASFDKGFHSPENQTALKELVERVVIPVKGKLSAEDLERESDPEFGHWRRKHSAVESAIHALEHHGLDRCLDHGIDGFERYVALAVLARNVLRLGQILHHRHQDQERHRKRTRYRQAA